MLIYGFLLRRTNRFSWGIQMFNILKELTKTIDTVIVLGAQNIRYILKTDLEGDAVIAYRDRNGINECRILLPVDLGKRVEHGIPKECIVVRYSYDIVSDDGYVIGRTFRDIAIGFLKSFIKPGEEIGIPFAYTDAAIFTALSRFWRLRDISRELRVFRAKKTLEDLNTINEIHIHVRKVLDKIVDVDRDVDGYLVANECFKELIRSADGVYVEPFYVSKDMISIRLSVKKGMFRIGYRWSIPLEKAVKNRVANISNVIEKVVRSISFKPRCLELVRTIRSYLRDLGLTKVKVEVCGIGTEECEYPSTSDCLYDDVDLVDGMAIKTEVILDNLIYLPKLLIIKDGRIEVI